MIKRPSEFPINFRVFLVVAATTFAAIMCAYLFAAARMLGIIVGSALLLAMLSLAVASIIKLRRGTIKLRYVITAVLCAALGCSAFIGATVAFDGWEKNSARVVGYRSIVGRVASVDVRTGDYRIDLEKLSVDGKRVPGILRLTIEPSDRNVGDHAACGDVFELDAYVFAGSLYGDGVVNGTAYRSNIRYYASAYSSDIRVTAGKPTVIEKFMDSWHSLLVENMGDRYGNIAFSMVTGDKRSLDTDITDMFSAAGLGHIMAVSGLHIGFVTVILNFVLGKIDKRVRFGIVSAILFAYCVIADFSPSVVRAFIMAEISMLAVLIGGRRDIMSSLCCAFSIILAVKPLYLFESGFLLSFGSIFGIALFASPIARALKKRGASEKVSSGIGSAVSVQIGAAPALFYFFKSFCLFALIVNSVLIPYVSVVFTSIIACSVIGAIPHLGVVLKLCEYLLMPLDYVAMGISAIPYSSVVVYPTAAIFLCYPVMFCASGFFMMRRGKLAVVLASVAACAAFTFAVPSAPSGAVCVPAGSSDSALIDGGRVIVVADECDFYALCSLLEENRCKAVDELYLYSVDEKSASFVLKLGERFDIGAVYADGFNELAEFLIDSGVNYIQVGDGATLERIASGGETVGYSYGDILFASGRLDENAFERYSVVRVKTVASPNSSTVYLTDRSEIAGDNIFTSFYGAYNYLFA